MLSSISWSQFLVSLIWLVVIYYCLVALLYYRTEILGLFKSRQSKQIVFEQESKFQDGALSGNEWNVSDGKENVQATGKVHELMAALKSLLATAVKAKTIKEELVMALQMLLRDYPDLKELPIVTEINQQIKKDCQNICSITLSDAEIRMLWNG